MCTTAIIIIIIIIIIIVIIIMSYFYRANWHMNMMKCALKFWRKSNQHCPNYYFAIIIHKSNQIRSKLMSNFGF